MIRVAASELVLTPHAQQRLRERGGIGEAELRDRLLEQLRAGAYEPSLKGAHVFVAVDSLTAVLRFDPSPLCATVYEIEATA